MYRRKTIPFFVLNILFFNVKLIEREYWL